MFWFLVFCFLFCLWFICSVFVVCCFLLFVFLFFCCFENKFKNLQNHFCFFAFVKGKNKKKKRKEKKREKNLRSKTTFSPPLFDGGRKKKEKEKEKDKKKEEALSFRIFESTPPPKMESRPTALSIYIHK